MWFFVIAIISAVFSVIAILLLCITMMRVGQLGSQKKEISELLTQQQMAQQLARHQFDQHQIHSLTQIQDSMQKATHEMREQVAILLKQHGHQLSQQFDKLTSVTQQKLKEISTEVNQQLSVGLEKTTSTFLDVTKRLIIIDEAQKKITDLSTNVVELQTILSDKRARGAFGEVQLSALLHNLLPEQHFSLQHTLSNGKRVDCLLKLPQPTGNLAIDAKFPLENYRRLQDGTLTPSEKKLIETQFKSDIKKHIQDIADKYIIPDETSDGAVLFIPAESVFSDIHGHYDELVTYALQKRVWLASPTTMMAILTTARAALKDAATRKQVHIIQEHLVGLGKDFGRFQKRMDDLAKHIAKANQDVELVHRSSQKLTNRFDKIEQVELTHEQDSLQK